MRKAIILLLVASMLSLASCSNKSVEANTSTAKSNTSSVVSADVSSVVSEDVSSVDSVSSVASKKSTANKNKTTSSEGSLNSLSTEDKIKRVYSESFFRIASEVTPKKSELENNPAIINTADYYFENVDSKIEKTMMGSMNKSEFNKHKDKITFYLKDTIVYAHHDAWEKTNKNTEKIVYFYYLGMVDEYNLFAIDFANGNMLMHGEFNRLAGYQFLSSPYITRTNFDEPDKYGNLKTSVKDKLEYSGIVLEKGGKYYTMEDLYIDNVISAKTVGKIYNALPKQMQMGMFNDYKDAYKVRAHKIVVGDWIEAENVILRKKMKADFISYYDKDGKFHVVYADD